MRYRILGPLEVLADHQPIRLSAPKHRALLAVLLVNANQVVSTDRLIAYLWGERAPATATNLVRVYVSQLRRLLQPTRSAAADPLGTHPPGYLLKIADGELDLEGFDRLVASAQAATAAGQVEAAATKLHAALSMWRGPALSDVASELLAQVDIPRLEERRMAALEARIDADLALGRHTALVGELQALATTHPLRERLHGQLMRALYRAGRQAEALAVFRDLRRALVEGLGVEPSHALQHLERQILAADPDLLAGMPQHRSQLAVAVPAPMARPRPEPPRQLPAASAVFTGRREELERLSALLRDRTGPARFAAISGAAGVGKSALAIHAGHQLAGDFPDGQLYADLHGATAGVAPLAPMEVLGRFLRALGMDGSQLPAQLDEAAARFRSLTADRRLLVVLDNARDPSQVAPLLPGGPGCGVVITSRRVMGGLDVAGHLSLDVFAPGQAVALLGRVVGAQRIAAEPQAGLEVARWCGWLPLALRIAGARLAARPGWPLRVLAERLADARCRLDELELPDIGVRAGFQVSCTELRDSPDQTDRAAAGAFSLLGVLDGPEVGVPVVARLLDQPEPDTERTLERLVDAQLLLTPSPGRYRMHDLLRVYAREQATHEHTPQQQAAALTRAFGLYAATCWHTLALLRPGDQRLTRADERWRKSGLEFTSDTAALDWLETERANLLAAVQQAATTPGVPSELAVQLAQALFGFFRVRGYWTGWIQVNQVALDVANRVGDRAAQAQALNDLGLAHSRQGRHAQALACHQQSLAIFRELDDHTGQAASLNNLGILYQRQGNYDNALDCQRESLTIKQALGDRRGQANSLGNLGLVHQQRGDHEQALACHQQSLAIFQELDDHTGQASSLNDLGLSHLRLGRYAQALACQQQSLRIFRELGDRDGQAYSLNDLGLVHQRQGNHEQALACHQQSLVIRRDLGDPYGQAESLRDLGVAVLALGHNQQARAHWREALALFEQLQSPDADSVRVLLADPDD